MNYGALKPQKIYWTTVEVEALTGVPSHTLRYWEKTLSFLKVPRNRAGRRSWRSQEIEFIKALKLLLEEKGLSVAEAGEEAKDSYKLRLPLKVKKDDSPTILADDTPSEDILQIDAVLDEKRSLKKNVAEIPQEKTITTKDLGMGGVRPLKRTPDPEVLRNLRAEVLAAIEELKQNSSSSKNL
ncbi:MAG: MerR family transcriptional regulator [Fibrobacteraceae bacterium]